MPWRASESAFSGSHSSFRGLPLVHPFYPEGTVRVLIKEGTGSCVISQDSAERWPGVSGGGGAGNGVGMGWRSEVV